MPSLPQNDTPENQANRKAQLENKQKQETIPILTDEQEEKLYLCTTCDEINTYIESLKA